MDEPEGDLNSGEKRLDSPKTYLHVRPYPDRHVRSYADTVGGRSRRESIVLQYAIQRLDLSLACAFIADDLHGLHPS